jgi:hypothetical protein
MDSRTGFDRLDTLEKSIRFAGGLMPIWRAWTRLQPVLTVRFEDYTSNILLEAGRLNAHLGLGLGDAALRQASMGVDPGLADQTRPAGSLHLHTGRRGKWQTVMNVREKELCQSLFGRALETMGYQGET